MWGGGGKLGRGCLGWRRGRGGSEKASGTPAQCLRRGSTLGNPELAGDGDGGQAASSHAAGVRDLEKLIY